MRVKLLRPAKITVEAGHVVDVPQSLGDFLISVGSARRFDAFMRETPEDPTMIEKPEVKKTARKTAKK